MVSKKLLAGLAALSVLAGPMAASAAEGPPEPPTATVTFPTGWRVTERDGLISARHPADKARCNRDLTRIPDLDGKTQAELNAQLARHWEAAEWASFMGARPDKVEIVGSGWEEDGPRIFRQATLTFRRGATPVTRKDVYGFVGIELVRGWAIIVACYAPTRDYQRQMVGLEAVVNSLKVTEAP